MRLGKLYTNLLVGSVVGLAGMGAAIAGPALDEATGEGGEAKVDPNSGAVLTEPASEETPVEYGVGFRLRNTRVPKGLLELFVERSGGGASNVGLGGELIRRRGNVELQLGFEYEKISVGQGVWIEKGQTVPAAEADYVLGPDAGSDLGWFTIEFTFMNHATINKYVSFRYGGGAGIGILTGELKRFNVQCAAGSSNTNYDPGCIPTPPKYQGANGPGTGIDSDGNNFLEPQPYDLPPVFPVVNAIVGIQIKPTPQFTINLEGGIRLMPFFGMSTAYFF